MEFDKVKFMEKLKELVAYGKKKKSVLEYQEINDFFRDMPLDAEQMEKVFEYLEASGIDVLRLSDMTERQTAIFSFWTTMTLTFPRKKRSIWKTSTFPFRKASALRTRSACT